MEPVETQPHQEDVSPSEFDYLLDKIAEAPFQTELFRHLYLVEFLSPDHLARVITSPQVKVPPAADTPDLLASLNTAGYEIEPFPGCTTDVPKYLGYLKINECPTATASSKELAWPCA